MKLIFGNRTYSSWSLRGWLAAKQCGLPFEEELVPMFQGDWEERRAALAASGHKVPMLVDGDHLIWDSLAIIEWLAEKSAPGTFWPSDDGQRALARSMSAEMHSSFMALRNQCPMNLRCDKSDFTPDEAVLVDVERIVALWHQAFDLRAGNDPYLFGAFGAADIMYAPVVTRFDTYGFDLPDAARAYCTAILDHRWMREWKAAAEAEPWTVEKYD